MKQILILIVLLFAGGIISAQTGEGDIENWAEIRGVCAEDGRELVEVSVDGTVDTIVVYGDADETTSIWYVGETKTRRFWFETENNIYVQAIVFVGGGSFYSDAYSLDSNRDCDTLPPEPNEPVNECLGIPFADFVNMIGFEPVSDGFVVDGLLYNFHDTLSFIVPESTVWAWDLYVDGYHVLRFEQSEDTHCAVTGVYPQQ